MVFVTIFVAIAEWRLCTGVLLGRWLVTVFLLPLLLHACSTASLRIAYCHLF
jgi:hypothetical protein